MKILLALSLITVAAFAVQDAPELAKPLEQHVWLQQLVGEWTYTIEATMEPGGDPMKWESRESVRSLGGLWIVAEGTSDMGGEPFTSLMTLGYDPRRGAFVGSWVDTMQTMMWTYVGHLDDDGRALTLEADGPSWSDPSQTTRYRDRIELVGADEKRMVSSVLGDDGTWTTFMTGIARREK